jgi:hypothetical protein
LCLPPGKEYELFAEYVSSVQPSGQSGIRGWSTLPADIKTKTFDTVFKFEEVLKINATAKYIGDPPGTHAEELTNIQYFFTLIAKVPKAGQCGYQLPR